MFINLTFHNWKRRTFWYFLHASPFLWYLTSINNGEIKTKSHLRTLELDPELTPCAPQIGADAPWARDMLISPGNWQFACLQTMKICGNWNENENENSTTYKYFTCVGVCLGVCPRRRQLSPCCCICFWHLLRDDNGITPSTKEPSSPSPTCCRLIHPATTLKCWLKL